MSELSMTSMNGGVQIVSSALNEQQIVYLDFDGEITRYSGETEQFDVTVKNAGMSESKIADILSRLNEKYASRGVRFTATRPVSGDYSTVYVGRSSDIAYTGLAETVDAGNQNKNDNAFVNLDNSTSAEKVAEVISHEVEHIVFGATHGGEGLEAYAARNDIWNGSSVSGLTIGANYYLNDTAKYQSKYGSAPENPHAYMDSCHVVEGGSLYVSSGGIATNITADEYSTLVFYVAPDTVFEGTSNGVAFSLRDGVLSGYINNGGSATAAVNIQSGGTATDITGINGWIRVSSGGLLSNCRVSSGGRLSLLGGDALNVVADSGVRFMLTVADTTNINMTSGGRQIDVKDGVLSGFVTEGVSSSWLYGIAGGRFIDTVANGQTWIGISGAYTENTILNSGARFDLRSGGIATDTIINKGGSMSVSNTATVASRTTIKDGGIMNLALPPKKDGGQTAKDTIVESGGKLMASIGKITGTLEIEKGGTVTISAGVNMDLNISVRSTEDSALFNDYSLISNGDKGDWTITVDAKQADGTYQLMGNAGSFSNTITIQDTELTKLGTIQVGSDLTVGDTIYSLVKNNGVLELTITNPQPEPAGPVRMDLNGDGIADVIMTSPTEGAARWTMDKDGTPAAWDNLSALPGSWQIFDAVDMNGDKLADIVLYDQPNNEVGLWTMGQDGVSGFESVAKLSEGDSLVTVRDFDGDKTPDLLVRQADGSVGVYGSGKFTAMSKDWNIAGVGDLNGDGIADLLLRNDSEGNGKSHIGAWVMSADGPSWQDYGYVNPENGIVGLGDFNGDGVADVLFNTNGSYGAWIMNSDGSINGWKSFCDFPDTLKVAYISDYNGDGIDDLLVSNGDDIAAVWVDASGENTKLEWKPAGTTSSWSIGIAGQV